jgi:arsenate reductase-like glutaredoxin family protein
MIAGILDTFIAELGWQALLNTRGTTWRKLDESLRNSIDNVVKLLITCFTKTQQHRTTGRAEQWAFDDRRHFQHQSLRNSIDNADAAAALMLEMPAIIKRPLLCAPGRISC